MSHISLSALLFSIWPQKYAARGKLFYGRMEIRRYVCPVVGMTVAIPFLQRAVDST